MVSTKADKVTGPVRGGDVSIVLALSEESRSRLNVLLAEGKTFDEAMGILADSIAVRVDPITNPRPDYANPFLPQPK